MANTKFVTFELHNIYTRVSHLDLLNALNDFLYQELPGNRYKWLSIDTIIQLVRFALKHHLFKYNGKIYRYIKGSPLNYTFTQLLFDIYIQQWQNILVRYVRSTNQFYGRYYHRGIFTWNKSSEDLAKCIKELNEQNADVPLTISSGMTARFLNAYIENRNGILYTRVYRDITTGQQPFLLPYSAEHARKLHRQWFRYSLARAIEYCPSFADFQEEYLHLELSFLANGYSLDFIKYLSSQFMKRFNPQQRQVISIRNSTNYKSLRQYVFRYFNKQMADTQREQQLQKLLTLPYSISFYYLFDWGNRIEFNRKFFELWSTIVKNDPQFAQYDFQLFLRSKHCFSLHALFVRYLQ